MDFDSRNTDIEQRYLKGETLESIGVSWKISRERVRQILKKRGITGDDGGIALWRRLNPKPVVQKEIIPEGLRRCKKCGTLDKEENFYKVRRQSGGFAYLHKPCRDKYMREYLAKRRAV